MNESSSVVCVTVHTLGVPLHMQWSKHALPSPPVLLLEYVNAQELPTDLRSITDRAATTLLWTELFRGHTYWDRYAERPYCASGLVLFFIFWDPTLEVLSYYCLSKPDKVHSALKVFKRNKWVTLSGEMLLPDNKEKFSIWVNSTCPKRLLLWMLSSAPNVY